MSFDESTVLQGQKILVVDDEPDNLEVVVVLLQMCDVDVVIGSNGQEGVETAVNSRSSSFLIFQCRS